MSIYTIVDASGEIVSVVDVPDIANLEANTPDGCVAIAGMPETQNSYWQNDAWVGKPARPKHSTWDAESKAWVDLRTLNDLKQMKRQELAEAWKAAMAAGVTVGGKLAPTDSTAWVDYLTLRLMAQEAGWVDTPIELSDGSFELLTQAKAATLWDALKSLRRAQVLRLRDKMEQVRDAARKEDVDAISWDAP